MTENKKESEEKHADDEKGTLRAIRASRKEPFSERMELLVQMCGSASELARLAGVSESAIRKWKIGESEPTVNRLVRLARATGVDVAWLATGDGSPNSTLIGEEPAEYAYKTGFSPEDVEGVVRLVEDHPATRSMEPAQKAAYIRKLLEWEGRRRNQDKRDAQDMLEEGPPQPGE